MDSVITECKTTEHGHRHNKHHHDHQHDCIFPFVYRGKTYHECTTDCLQRGEDHKGKKAWCDKTEMRAWCATKIDKKDVMKDWELCGQGCPGTGEAPARLNPCLPGTICNETYFRVRVRQGVSLQLSWAVRARE